MTPTTPTREASLATRKTIKRRKPTFTRQDSHKKNEIKRTGWRHPKGLHSKMREGRRGYKTKISIGWKSPAASRGLHPSGLLPILVHRVQDLGPLDPKIHGAIIASGVGAKKRLAILSEATADSGKGIITILNHPQPEEAITKIKASLAKRKEEALARKKSKEQSAKATPKKLEAKVEDAPKTKDEEKKEQDKLLTQREV